MFFSTLCFCSVFSLNNIVSVAKLGAPILIIWNMFLRIHVLLLVWSLQRAYKCYNCHSFGVLVSYFLFYSFLLWLSASWSVVYPMFSFTPVFLCSLISDLFPVVYWFCISLFSLEFPLPVFCYLHFECWTLDTQFWFSHFDNSSLNLPYLLHRLSAVHLASGSFFCNCDINTQAASAIIAMKTVP